MSLLKKIFSVEIDIIIVMSCRFDRGIENISFAEINTSGEDNVDIKDEIIGNHLNSFNEHPNLISATTKYKQKKIYFLGKVNKQKETETIQNYETGQ